MRVIYDVSVLGESQFHPYLRTGVFRVVERVARSGKRGAYRPGREAAMLRRLLRQHSGTLPAQASLAVAPGSVKVPWHSTVMVAAPFRLTTGAVVSTTLTVRVALPVLLPSVAV